MLSEQIKMDNITLNDSNKGDISNDTKQLIDAIVVPVITPNNPRDNDILENLENMILGNDAGGAGGASELNSVRLMIGIRKVVKSAERLIKNGSERKEAVIYVCKMAVLHNVKDNVKRDVLLLMIDEVVPEVIEMVVDAAQNHEDYGVVANGLGKKLCSCLLI